jgi:hypothetical protein
MVFYGALFLTVRGEELERNGRTECAETHRDDFAMRFDIWRA